MCLGLLTTGESLFLDHCTYGVYSPHLSATTAPPMLKCPDHRIREWQYYFPPQLHERCRCMSIWDVLIILIPHIIPTSHIEIPSAYCVSMQPDLPQVIIELQPETLYKGDDALSTKPVMHYQGTAYLCY